MYQSNTSNNRIDSNSNDATEIEPTKASQPEGRTSHNEDDLSIHDFDFALICEYFASIDRQDPGSDEATRRALSFVPNIDACSRIADIGCGTGSSTLLLAADTGAHVTAIDLFPQFLTRLSERAKAAGVYERITTAAASMDALDYAEASFDLLWCEGAIYNIGFENGLRSWRPILKDGGYIAVTDATWLTDRRPAEVETFWHDAYPGITDIAGNIAAIQRCGTRPWRLSYCRTNAGLQTSTSPNGKRKTSSCRATETTRRRKHLSPTRGTKPRYSAVFISTTAMPFT